MRHFIDCEFDGHGGSLISVAMVAEDGRSLHVRAMDASPRDPWVIANVLPVLDSHKADWDHSVFGDNIGSVLRRFLGEDEAPTIIADSPVDIGRFCAAISTGPDGGWESTDYPRMTFEVHNVDCYPTDLPGAVQHNAWWDAMALRHRLRDNGSGSKSEDAPKSAAEAEGPQSGLSGSEGIAQ
jgi:hypothetical protein